MSYPNPPYSQFEILSGIMDLEIVGDFPTRQDVIDSTDWIMFYAGGACETPITEEQAKVIQYLANRWLDWLEQGENLETCERWAKVELKRTYQRFYRERKKKQKETA